jgi:hypothetical protein
VLHKQLRDFYQKRVSGVVRDFIPDVLVQKRDGDHVETVERNRHIREPLRHADPDIVVYENQPSQGAETHNTR